MRSISPELARSALDAAPDAMIIIDGPGVIRYANRQTTALFGYAHEDLVGQTVELLMPERFRTLHVEHRDEYRRSFRARAMGAGSELFGRRRDGSEFSVEISLSPIEDGGEVLIAAAIRDVSYRKSVEAELKEARELAECASGASERARQIAVTARETADRANRAKSRFLAMASHDIRQPLQTLALLNGSLKRIAGGGDAAEAVSQQEVAIDAMSRLLSALLDISKLESGAITPDPTDFAVGSVFEELRRSFASTAAAKGLQLEVTPTGESAHSDASLVEQILRNLVANAIKYTRQGFVALRCLALEDQTVRLEVLDTGIGIAPSQLPYIYDEFYQVGVSTSSTRDGYGLGLSIVQRLVSLLNLKLQVRSELGKGSVFSLTLPAGVRTAADRRRAAPISREVDPHSGRPHVLLVEDDKSVRDATTLLLAVEGYRVAAVSTLREALDRARSAEPLDLLITDYHLSEGETGTEVIAGIREILGGSLKAVLMTGDTSQAVKELPADPLMRIASKPVKADELLALMRGLLAA